jgi:hypothetical protein
METKRSTNPAAEEILRKMIETDGVNSVDDCP